MTAPMRYGPSPRAWGQQSRSYHLQDRLRTIPTCVGTTLDFQRLTKDFGAKIVFSVGAEMLPSAWGYVKGKETNERIIPPRGR